MRAALDRHRDDDSPVLSFAIPVDRLLDAEYCATLNADIESVAPAGFERYPARSATTSLVPNKPGVYMFVWAPPFRLAADSLPEGVFQGRWVIYVGKAGGPHSGGTLRARYKTYEKIIGRDPELLWKETGTTRDGLLNRWLQLAPLEYWCVVIEDPDQIETIEQKLIKLLEPPINRNHKRVSAKLTQGKARPAF